MDKSKQRALLKKNRQKIPNKPELSEIIVLKLLKYIKQNSNHDIKIASYISTNDEVDTTNLHKCIDCYLPVINKHRKHSMLFTKNSSRLVVNKYGIYEPDSKVDNLIAPWDIDLVITPLLAFNKNKQRFGMGGGYYDYSFSFRNMFKKPLLIGIAFDEQQNDGIITNSHDLSLDYIFTQTRVL